MLSTDGSPLADLHPHAPSLTGALWVPRHDAVADVEMLVRRLRVDARLASCLVGRGLRDAPSARRFLSPTLEALHDPFAMHGMDIAVARLQSAVRTHDPIRVVTDYDVDGTTSSLILQGTLRLLGHGDVTYAIPHRIDEGYGFSVRAAEEAAADGVKLIVTADIGVKDHVAVARARELGLDVLILDHHLPPGEDVPRDALAVLCPPQRACSYPNKSLAACGVSLKLAQALLRGHARFGDILDSLLKLAAIGTVADVVDLMEPENRSIVALGLQALNRGRHRPGLAALLRVANTPPGNISASDLGFRVGPRINAAGRVASATAVIELLTEAHPERAWSRAQELDGMNQERRQIQDEMVRVAIEQVTEPVPPFIVVWGNEDEGWHRGVAGIVAARIRDRFHRPAAVVARSGESATGSVRSIPEVHAVEALEAVSDLLERFGGHAAAAGFSLSAVHLERFKSRLAEVTHRMLEGKLPELRRPVDLVLGPGDITRALQRELSLLEPHGKGNAAPVIEVRGVRLQQLRMLKERHIKASLGGDRRQEVVDVVWWGAAGHFAALSRGREVDLLGRVEVNRFNGNEILQINLEDARHHGV